MINCRRCGEPFRWFTEGVYAKGVALLICPWCEHTNTIETHDLPREVSS